MTLLRPVLAAVAILAATPTGAGEKAFAGYVMSTKSEIVEGVMLVDGYAPADVVAFIREDCASGRVSALQFVGNPRKKRGNVFQKFQTTCAGGPSPRIGQTSRVAVEVERMPDGRNMTEYTFGVGGDLRYTRYIR